MSPSQPYSPLLLSPPVLILTAVCVLLLGRDQISPHELSPEHALASANRVLVLHEGRLIADGAPQDVIDSAFMARLYQVAVEQIDAGGHRFFIPC
jgi:ABC-type cobalamin transport system ATPase subunit